MDFGCTCRVYHALPISSPLQHLLGAAWRARFATAATMHIAVQASCPPAPSGSCAASGRRRGAASKLAHAMSAMCVDVCSGVVAFVSIRPVAVDVLVSRCEIHWQCCMQAMSGPAGDEWACCSTRRHTSFGALLTAAGSVGGTATVAVMAARHRPTALPAWRMRQQSCCSLGWRCGGLIQKAARGGPPAACPPCSLMAASCRARTNLNASSTSCWKQPVRAAERRTGTCPAKPSPGRAHQPALHLHRLRHS